MNHIRAAITAVGLSCTVPALAQPQVWEYEVIRIEPIAPDDASGAYGLNEYGDVAGVSANVGQDMAGNTSLWLTRDAYGLAAGEYRIECPWNPDDGHTANDVNDLGQICGFATAPVEESSILFRATRWDPATMTLVNLGYLGTNIYTPQPQSIAKAINNEGHVVGYTTVPPGTSPVRQFYHPFVHNGTQMVDLGTFGGVYGQALDINDAGQIVGFATYRNPNAPVFDPLDGEELSAAIWLPEPAFGLPAGISDLTPSPAIRPEGWGAEAAAINERGEVAIRFPLHVAGSQYTTAVGLWLPAPNYGLPAGFNLIGTFAGGGDDTSVSDMNDHGWMVGRYVVARPPGQFPIYGTFLYANGQWYDLDAIREPNPDPSYSPVVVEGINDANEIIARGLQAGGAKYVGLKMIPMRPCQGDLNDDGHTDASDFNMLAANFGSRPLARRHEGDLDRDGDVDFSDFVILAGDFGCSVGAQLRTDSEGE